MRKLQKKPTPVGAPRCNPAARIALGNPDLLEPSATSEQANPADRVEGSLPSPTGEFGTVERTNEEDAVVKWDYDGRIRLHKPWLRKVSTTPATKMEWSIQTSYLSLRD